MAPNHGTRQCRAHDFYFFQLCFTPQKNHKKSELWYTVQGGIFEKIKVVSLRQHRKKKFQIFFLFSRNLSIFFKSSRVISKKNIFLIKISRAIFEKNHFFDFSFAPYLPHKWDFKVVALYVRKQISHPYSTRPFGQGIDYTIAYRITERFFKQDLSF